MGDTDGQTRAGADDGLLFVLKRGDREWLSEMKIGRKKCSFSWAKSAAGALAFDRTLACAFAGMLEGLSLRHVPVEIDDQGRVKS